MARLRKPDGCPWDREQTPQTIRKYTLEETYEVLDAIERQDWPNLSEELGDLLLQVLFYAQMAEEAGHFCLTDVLEGLNRKLVRRHPHVFGEAAAAEAGNAAVSLAAVPAGGSEGAAAAVVANWRSIKAMEKSTGRGQGAQANGSLAEVLRAQSALAEASKLGAAAARVGFDWPGPEQLLEKIREEAAEVEAELQTVFRAVPGQDTLESSARLAEEVGDLLFTAANLARQLRVDAEMVLRDANAKFRRRFEAMEQASRTRLEELSAEQLEQAWQAVKEQEKAASAEQLTVQEAGR